MKKFPKIVHLSFGILCVLGWSLSAQELDPRVMPMDRRGMYAEALALCLRDSSPAAQWFVGDYYYHGRKGVARDVKKGKEFYLKALDGLLPLAEKGDALAQYRVARCLEFGKEDMDAAEGWYFRAAEGGNAKAMIRYALLEQMRNPSPRGEFPSYLQRAAELGDMDAKAWRGAMLVEHKATQEEGVKLLQEAAKDGSPIALARLAALHYLGEGGFERDAVLALNLLQETVDKGFSEGIGLLEDVRRNQPPPPPWRPEGAPPGFGFPGELLPYEVTSDKLKENLDKFDLTAGVFVRDPIPSEAVNPEKYPQRLPWLLHSPVNSSEPVPMVIYFGGTGEHGRDLMAQFNQTAVFSKVCTPEFQQRRPCYLFAPMLPNDRVYNIHPYQGQPTETIALINDVMYAMICSLDNPPVDTNRLYVTGLSFGGIASSAMLSSYPGRFAAALPVSSFLRAEELPESNPGNYWLFLNEGDYNRPGMKGILDKAAETVVSRGGEFKLSLYPQGGHDAWSKAWREDVAWDWMFSKSLGQPEKQNDNVATKIRVLPTPVCSANVPGENAANGPERGVDGLDGTSYVSTRPMATGDWWQAVWPEPITGKFTVETGTLDGEDKLSNGRVEVSQDGVRWFPAGNFDEGTCKFEQRTRIRFLRVLPEPNAPETLTLRRLTVMP